MSRIRAMAAMLVLSGIAAVTASATGRPLITQAASGKVFRVAKGDSATLRLSNRWRWSDPSMSTNVVELTPVEYFVDPGFREWTIDARKSGRTTIRSLGRPSCSTCGLATRRFAVTIVVAAGR
jgi:hypothetical protein